MTVSCSTENKSNKIEKVRKELRGKGSIQEKLRFTKSMYSNKQIVINK